MKFLPMQTLTRSRPIFHRSHTSACGIYGNAGERSRHLRYMEVLAERTGRPLHAILPLYEHVLSALRPQALITDYLPIMVSKRVRRMLGI